MSSTSNADMNKQISRVWTFASDSNPNLEYETLQYTDGTKSCIVWAGPVVWPQMEP